MLTEIEVKDFTDFEKRFYELANGEYIFIEVSGNDVHVELIDKPAADFTSLGTIGSFEFDMLEEDCGPEVIYRTKVLHMDLSGFGGRYKRKGIGKEIIRIKEEEMGEYVIFGEDDGSRNSDGSYLIDDGPGFARAIYAKRNAK